MNRQQPLALPPPAGGAEWSEQSLLDPATRRALVSLNHSFLDLAAALADEDRLKLIAGLPLRAIDALIDADAQRRLCERLPYALFDLRFGDAAYWEGQAAALGGVRDSQNQAAPAADERVVALVRSALMLAWHLAQVNTLAIRLVFGAVPGSAAVLRSLSVGAVDALARRVAPVLAARFGARTRFWVQFEGCAADPCEESVNVLQLLGLQIQGAESARQQALQRRFRRALPA
ncbi:MAG: hypothetical protein FJ191_08985 [Gammaproteobacteria bacterium]|nr:hypothetical protein [Gammaproteobacteria bacterium]